MNELFINFIHEIVDVDKPGFSGRKLLFNEKIANCLLDIAKANQIQFFRLLELLIKLSMISSDYLNECEKYFKLNNLIALQLNDENDDVLSKLNCIEMIRLLSDVKYGYLYLNNHLKYLISYLNSNEESSKDIMNEKFLIPGIIKLFGYLAYLRPNEIQENYSIFFTYLFNNILLNNSNNSDIQAKIGISIDTLAFIFKNNEAKFVIKKFYQDIVVNSVFKQLLGFIQFSINDLRIKSLEFLSALVGLNYKNNLILNKMSFSDSTSLTLNLFEHFISNLSDNKYTAMEKLFDIILHLAKQPFMDLRLITHSCFLSFVESKWGLEYLFKVGNNGIKFISYLKDRSTEMEKEGCLSKFELLNSIVNSEFAVDCIDLNELEVFKKYIREGPFYKESKMAVEYENE